MAGGAVGGWRGGRLVGLRMVAVEQQQAKAVLLHGRLVARRRRTVLELWVHHGWGWKGDLAGRGHERKEENNCKTMTKQSKDGENVTLGYKEGEEDNLEKTHIIKQGQKPITSASVSNSKGIKITIVTLTGVGVVRAAESRCHPGHEASGFTARWVMGSQAEHDAARGVPGGEVPRHARHGDQHDANACRGRRG